MRLSCKCKLRERYSVLGHMEYDEVQEAFLISLIAVAILDLEIFGESLKSDLFSIDRYCLANMKLALPQEVALVNAA